MRNSPPIILRNPQRLTQVTLRRLRRIDFDARPLVEVEIERDGTGFYGFVEKPLECAVEPERSLQAAWQALADVRALTDTVRAHVETVLAATAASHAQTAVLPLPPWPESAGLRPRATAAHPRAYQGTTYKPPKPKSVPGVDLRPYLCDPKGQDWLLTTLGIPDEAEWSLPAPFRVRLWPFQREHASENIPVFLALFWALRLDERPTLLAAVAKLVSLQADANTGRWLQFVTEQPALWQELFIELLIASKTYTLDAERTVTENQARFAQVREGNWPVHRLFWLLRGLVNGLGPDYLMAGYRMSDRNKGDDSFAQTCRSGYFPEAFVTDLMAHLKPADDYYDSMALSVWRRCGELPGPGEALETVDWVCLAPETACRYLWLFLNCADYASGDREARWRFVREQIGRIEEQLHAVPAQYQGKWVAALKEYFWYWNTAASLAENLPHAFILLRRLAAPPFLTECDTTDITVDYLGNLSGALRERFLTAPDPVFRHLEQACRRRNNTQLIGWGTWSLTRLLPDLAVEGLMECPKRFCQLAKLLGCLPEPVRDETVRAFGQQVVSSVTRTRLQLLEAVVLRRLAQNFEGVTPEDAAKHALQIYYQADRDNRRAFQKFLRAHWAGQDDYLHAHPQTQAWWKRHPNVDVGAWRQGVTLNYDLPEQGRVQLAIEQDPLEALKLGTHVGSCLGLGGSFSYSAMAVVLDANKQVVYARNGKGNVIARQVVAISDEERLVCFDVYPLGVSDIVKKCFADFDRRLAEALRLPIFDPNGEEDYTISQTLSRRWWDDYPWDLIIEDEAPCLTSETC